MSASARWLLDSGIGDWCLMTYHCKEPNFILLVRQPNVQYFPLYPGDHLKIAVLVCKEHLAQAISNYKQCHFEILNIFQITEVTDQILHPENNDDGDSL